MNIHLTVKYQTQRRTLNNECKNSPKTILDSAQWTLNENSILDALYSSIASEIRQMQCHRK